MKLLASEIDLQMKEMFELDEELRKIELTYTSSKVDAIKFIIHQLLLSLITFFNTILGAFFKGSFNPEKEKEAYLEKCSSIFSTYAM